jgi:hypothetical protein
LYSGQCASLYVESSGSLRLKNWLPVPPYRQYIERQSTESILMGNTIIETFEGPSNRLPVPILMEGKGPAAGQLVAALSLAKGQIGPDDDRGLRLAPHPHAR